MITGPKKLRKIAKFCAEVLKIEVTLDIKYSDDPDCSECVSYTNGTFTLLIQDWLKGSDLIHTVAHEMVHVWQHVRGDLVTDYDREVWIWKGIEFANPSSVEAYLLMPWELEARSLEAWLEWKWRHR